MTVIFPCEGVQGEKGFSGPPTQTRVLADAFDGWEGMFDGSLFRLWQGGIVDNPAS